jgi:hypothetical protein
MMPTNQALGGDLLAYADQVRQHARDYYIPVSDDFVVQWAKNMYAGKADPQALDAYLAQQAKIRFPTMAAQIGDTSMSGGAGMSPRQLFSGLQNEVAKQLEVDPTTIDMMDPKWSKLIDYVDPTDKSGTHRLMTYSEADQFARSQPEWQTTKGAQDQAYAMAAYLTQQMGAVK